MPVAAIKTSFAAGEVTPSLWYRVDLQKYASGARTIKNCIVHPHGGVSNRPGTEYVTTGKTANKVIRLLPFEFSSTQRYVIHAGDLYFRFILDGSEIEASPSAWLTATAYVAGDFVTNGGFKYYCLIAHTSGTFATDLSANKWVLQTAYEIITPYAESILSTLSIAQSADTVFIACPTIKPKMLQRTGNAAWTIVDYPFVNGPFKLPNTTTANTITASGVTGSVTLTASVATFNILHIGALYQLKHYIEGQTSSVSISSAAAQSSIKCGGTWRLITHGTWAGKLAIQKSTDGGSTWTTLRTFASSSDNNVNTFGTETTTDGIPFLVRLNMTTYTSGTCNADLTTDPFTQMGIAKITAFSSSTSVTATVLREIGNTTATIDWAEGAWSDYQGWPSQVAFSQDRLVWAATTNEPQTEWMTKTGDYYNFIRNTPLLDTDGITVNLPSRQLNAVNGLIPLINLVALTSSASWRTAATSGNILTPSTVSNDVQGYDGSYGVAPVVIGNRAIFVDSSGSAVRDLGFQLQDNGFVGNHISILSEHLFFNKTVVEMGYQQSPDSIIWFVLDDGTLATCTYLREQDVIAWTRCETTDGLYESVCVIQGGGYKEVYFSVNRGGTRYIERMVRRLETTEPKDQYFVDCGITYHDPKAITAITKANPGVLTITGHGYSNGDLVDLEDIVGMTELNDARYEVVVVNANSISLKNVDTAAAINTTNFTTYVSGGTASKAITTVTGLDHLEGVDVAVLGDGNVYGNYEDPMTVTSGEITLGSACSKVIVGIPYQSDVETLNFDLPDREGTSQGKKMKISKLVLQMLNSRGGFIGPDFNRLKEISGSARATYDDPLELYTGEIAEVMGGDYEDGARVCFRQNDPLPFTIATIIPTITTGGTVTR